MQPTRSDVTIAVTTNIETLDPAKTVANLSGAVLQHVFEGLTRVTPEGNVESVLAQSWSVSADGLTWTFNLARGVTFHDGTPFNAQAVKANFDRVLNPENTVPLRNNISGITGVNVRDDYTVEIVTEKVFSGLPLALGHMVGLLVSPRSIEQWGEELGQHRAAGTGPFRVASFELPEELVLERNPSYWGTPPVLEKISIQAASESETRTAMVLSDEADLALYIPPEHVSRFKAEQDFEVLSVPSIRLFMIHLPMGLPEMQDLKVRQALNYAVDRQQLVETIYGGHAVVADSGIGPGPFGYKPTTTFSYDPQRTAQLLSEAGWTKGPDGILQKDGRTFPSIKLAASRGRYPNDAALAEAVAGYLRDAGIPVEVQVDEFATFWAAIKENSRKENWMVQMAWGFPTLDGAAFLCQVYDPEHYYNYGGYNNPGVKEQCNRIGAATDTARRRALIEDGVAMVLADLPAIYLLAPSYLAAQRKGLKNTVLHPGEYHTLRSALWQSTE